MCDWGKWRGTEWGKKKRKLDVPFVALPCARLCLRSLSPRLSRGKCKELFSEQFARSPNQTWLMISQSNCFLKVPLLMQISRSFPWSPFPEGNTHENKSIKTEAEATYFSLCSLDLSLSFRDERSWRRKNSQLNAEFRGKKKIFLIWKNHHCHLFTLMIVNKVTGLRPVTAQSENMLRKKSAAEELKKTVIKIKG